MTKLIKSFEEKLILNFNETLEIKIYLTVLLLLLKMYFNISILYIVMTEINLRIDVSDEKTQITFERY